MRSAASERNRSCEECAPAHTSHGGRAGGMQPMLGPVRCSVDETQARGMRRARDESGRLERSLAAARSERFQSQRRDALGQSRTEDREHVMHPRAFVPQVPMPRVFTAWRASCARDGSHEVVPVVPGVPPSRAGQANGVEYGELAQQTWGPAGAHAIALERRSDRPLRPNGGAPSRGMRRSLLRDMPRAFAIEYH